MVLCIFYGVTPFVSDSDLSLRAAQTAMEMAGRAMNMAARVINNNYFVDVCLGGCFIVLGVRSLTQQKDIETLEAEKQSLIQSNKALKKSIWESKQTLYAEASSSESPIVPLSKLKAIYGEAVISVTASKDAEKEKTSSKLLI